MIRKLILGLEILKENDEGQGMVEYAMVISFVAIVVLAAITLFSTELSNVFTMITNSLT